MRGGNLVKLHCGAGCSQPNLHAFWDDVLGSYTTNLEAAADAARYLPPPPAELASIADEKVWLNESFELAKGVVYATPIGVGTGPFILTDDYKAKALAAAKVRIALAGARLPKLLTLALAP
jgi:hypothetical protein